MSPRQNTIKKREQTMIYPGEYCAAPSEASAIRKALHDKHTKIVEPPVSIHELPDHFRIELAVPGHNKEDFFITTDTGKLFITAVSRQPVGGSRSPFKSRPYQRSFIRRMVLLPANADPDFAEAGYRDGILHICLFKTPYPGKVGPGTIVVY